MHLPTHGPLKTQPFQEILSRGFAELRQAAGSRAHLSVWVVVGCGVLTAERSCRRWSTFIVIMIEMLDHGDGDGCYLHGFGSCAREVVLEHCSCQLADLFHQNRQSECGGLVDDPAGTEFRVLAITLCGHLHKRQVPVR